MPSDISRTIEAVWRIEAAKVIGALARRVRDVGLAEELAQDALVAAIEQWPKEGVPDNPGAWLLAVGKRRAIDRIRRDRRAQEKWHLLAEDESEDAPEIPERDAVDDDLLRLMFTACHPLLSAEARVALALRLLGGLTTDEIARAFLVPEPTIAQRIVRAKRMLKGIPFEAPRGEERAKRLPSVLEAIYLIFNEGYTATAGENWMRPQLCEEATRLGRILAHLTPDEAEVHGLLALMELQASRFAARTAPDGEAVLLLEQDRARWDRVLIRHGLAALAKAEVLGKRGPYTLQAAIAGCHARARTAEETDWVKIAALYAALMQAMPSPVVELNRAVAMGIAFGPEAGIEIADALMQDGSLRNYHLLPAVRGDLLEKLGRFDEARAEFERAAALTRNGRERELMKKRAAALMRSV